jgi:hypothetical protein
MVNNLLNIVTVLVIAEVCAHGKFAESYTHTHTHIHVHNHIHTYAYMHTYTHAHTYIHTYTHMQTTARRMSVYCINFLLLE